VNAAIERMNGIRAMFAGMLMLCSAALIAGCGGGNPSPEAQAPVAAECVPGDASTSEQCGTVYVGITDADGDFLSYTVDVVSLQLVRADGLVVETLPGTTRLDFSQYVDLTEFVAAAYVPPGTYVSGRITLDYADADVVVEVGNEARSALIVDDLGQAVERLTMNVRLANRHQLMIRRGLPSLLTVDFDLAASHSVDTLPIPALASVEPFIVAEIDPIDDKDIRVRGLLVDVDEAGMSYTISLRPFHDRIGDFGPVTVHVTSATEFEIDGALYTGAEGLRALAASGAGTPTVAFGSLQVAERRFTAEIVYAGSSVPGIDLDAVNGNIIARSGDSFTVRGATVILADGEARYYRGDVTVTVGPNTRVFKRWFDGLLDTGALSVGQRVTVRGSVTGDTASGLAVDATEGAVRMHVTRLAGTVNQFMAGEVDIELDRIDGRPADVFDFSGTGMTVETDADPANYEVATGNLLFDGMAEGSPVVVYGFPNAFGAAPPDFEGRTVADYSDVRSVLGVGWAGKGTVAPFLDMGSDGLVLDNGNPEIGTRHYVSQGPVLIDLTKLDSPTVIAPRETGRMLFGIATADSLELYADFDDFEQALTLALDGATTARSMYARGRYDVGTNVFRAYKIGMVLIEP